MMQFTRREYIDWTRHSCQYNEAHIFPSECKHCHIRFGLHYSRPRGEMLACNPPNVIPQVYFEPVNGFRFENKNERVVQNAKA